MLDIYLDIQVSLITWPSNRIIQTSCCSPMGRCGSVSVPTFNRTSHPNHCWWTFMLSRNLAIMGEEWGKEEVFRMMGEFLRPMGKIGGRKKGRLRSKARWWTKTAPASGPEPLECPPPGPGVLSPGCFFFNFYLFMIVTHTHTQRGRDTGGGSSGLHAPEARRGIHSRVSRITPWAKGRR